MKKFEQALLDAEKQNSLKRVKLKLDPKIREAQDFSQYEGYEGYVLSETETHVELQIKNKRIILPKIVIEGKLADFIKGVAPKTYQTGKSNIDKIKDEWQYINDPNASSAERLGRKVGAAGKVAGGLTNAALKAANPMTYLQGIERVATAPTRFVGNLLGIKTNKAGDTPPPRDFGSQLNFIYKSQVPEAQQDYLGQLLIDAATNAGFVGNNYNANPNTPVDFYTTKDLDNAGNKNLYIVVGAELLSPFPGSRSYNRQRVPIGNITQYTNLIKTGIASISKTGSSTLDNAFFDALNRVSIGLKQEIVGSDKNKKQQFVLQVLHVPSLKIFETGGILTENQNNGDFTLSEKYA